MCGTCIECCVTSVAGATCWSGAKVPTAPDDTAATTLKYCRIAKTQDGGVLGRRQGGYVLSAQLASGWCMSDRSTHSATQTQSQQDLPDILDSAMRPTADFAMATHSSADLLRPSFCAHCTLAEDWHWNL